MRTAAAAAAAAAPAAAAAAAAAASLGVMPPLSWNYHTGACHTGAPQDLFRCLSEQLAVARAEIPLEYGRVVLVCLESFVQYRWAQLARVYTEGVETHLAVQQVCAIANNCVQCVPAAHAVAPRLG